jgi:hypothetical protein
MATGTPGVDFPQAERPMVITAPRITRPVSLGAFLFALVVFALVYFALPGKARPWAIIIIVLGALVASGGGAAITDLSSRIYKK